jgi:hypothetical protein
MSEKYQVSNGWIKCLCVFCPSEIPMEEWETKPIAEKEKLALWTAYRFKISELTEYSRSPYPKATWILLQNGSYKNIDIPLEEFDQIICP